MEQRQIKGEWRSDFDGPPAAPGGPEPAEAGADPSEEEAIVEASGSIGTFPEEWRNDFEGLMYLGYLEDEVGIPAHKPVHRFVMQTILPSAKLDIVQICRPFEGSIGYAKAFKAACVAAAMVRVDGQQIIAAERERSAIRQKYEYVINTWYEPIIDLLYNFSEELEARQLEIMRQLGIVPTPEP